MAAKKTTKKATKKSAKKSTRKASTSRSRSEAGAKRGFPELVFANASPRSLGGTSMFDTSGPISADDAVAYTSEEAVVRAAVNQLQIKGFRILGISAQTINIAAPPGVYEDAFGITLFTEEREVIKGGASADSAEFIDCRQTDVPGLIDSAGTDMVDSIEGVAIEEPVYFDAPSAYGPKRDYWHLNVPGDVAAGVNAERAHRLGYTGKGVKVAMVDSGWYRHPFFTRRGYRSNPVVLGPGAANPLADESGHGTGESANVFSIAPDVDFTMVKVNFANSLGAFNAAVALDPDVLTNSWGSNRPNPPLSAANQALGAAVALAWSSGIVVVFSNGNGNKFGFPGQHPDVICAGGVFMDEDESLQASSYTAGFPSAVFPGRNTPDVSGLVGMSPGAQYIMLPVEAGDNIDVGLSGGSHPGRDETEDDDGWAAFSGTSAAAPQLAGVAALMKQACGKLTPEQVRSIMMSTATDVTVGSNAMGAPAGVGYDNATGRGLVDANRCVLRSRLSCLTIQPPITILPPIQPPVQPPIQPPITIAPPIQPPIQPPITIAPPIRPIQPVQPVQPVQPIQPIQPIRPIGPVIQPPAPSHGDALVAQAQSMVNAGYPADQVNAWLAEQLGATGASSAGAGGLTAEEAAALEEAILDSDEFEL